MKTRWNFLLSTFVWSLLRSMLIICMCMYVCMYVHHCACGVFVEIAATRLFHPRYFWPSVSLSMACHYSSLSIFHLALCCRFCANVSFFFKTTKASCLHHSQILSESRILETQHIKSHSVSVEGWLSWSPAFTWSQPLYTLILYIHTDFYFWISGSFWARFS